jgi:hypothetical protein
VAHVRALQCYDHRLHGQWECHAAQVRKWESPSHIQIAENIMRQGHGIGAARITSNNERSSVGPSPAQVLCVARGRFEAAVKLNPGHTGTSLANKTRALVWKSGSRSQHPVLKTHQRAFKRLKIMCLFPHSPNQCWTHGFAKGRAASGFLILSVLVLFKP